MSRPVLEITLRLPDGQVLNGRGRNLTVTMERIYNQAIASKPRQCVRLIEHIRHGHVKKGEHRYQGTFHAGFVPRGGGPIRPEVVVVAEVKEPQ